MAEVRPDGSSTVIRTVCPPSPVSPHVLSFRSRTAQIRVTYVWLPHRPSAFVLYFDFVRLQKDSSEAILVSVNYQVEVARFISFCNPLAKVSEWELSCPLMINIG
uniref:Uncharacterized protein n=1 Tax=Strigamia maritima TaxID=126957 RepID=T1J503_STRMM